MLSLECELIIPGSTAFQCDSRPHLQGPACLQVPTTFQRSSASLRLCLMSIYTLRFLTQRRLSWQSTLPQGFCSGLHLGFHSLQWPSEGRILWSLSYSHLHSSLFWSPSGTHCSLLSPFFVEKLIFPLLLKGQIFPRANTFIFLLRGPKGLPGGPGSHPSPSM